MSAKSDFDEFEEVDNIIELEIKTCKAQMEWAKAVERVKNETTEEQFEQFRKTMTMMRDLSPRLDRIRDALETKWESIKK